MGCSSSINTNYDPYDDGSEAYEQRMKGRRWSGIIQRKYKDNDSNNNNKTKPQQLVQSRYKNKTRTMNRFLFNTSNTSKKRGNNSQNKSVKKTSLSLMKSAIDPESELSFLQNTNENIHITTNYLNTDTLRKKPYCKSESSNQTTGNKKVKNIRNVKYISDNFATKLVDNLFKTKKI